MVNVNTTLSLELNFVVLCLLGEKNILYCALAGMNTVPFIHVYGKDTKRKVVNLPELHPWLIRTNKLAHIFKAYSTESSGKF